MSNAEKNTNNVIMFPRGDYHDIDTLQKIEDFNKIFVRIFRNAMSRDEESISEPDEIWDNRNQETFSKLQTYLDLLSQTFDDVIDRIQYLGVIKDIIYSLKNSLDVEFYKYERRICIMIYDAIHKLKAEEMKMDQLDTLNDVFGILYAGRCAKQQYTYVDKALRNNGLSWIVGHIDE